jgi:hypothetical protein
MLHGTYKETHLNTSNMEKDGQVIQKVVQVKDLKQQVDIRERM